MSKFFYSTWYHKHVSDPFVKLSKANNLRARSAYKLQEIQKTQKFLKPGQIVVKDFFNFQLDCGAAPGGWSLIAAQHLKLNDNSSSRLIAADLLDIEPIDKVEFYKMDITSKSFEDLLSNTLNSRKLDVIMSDMAPNLTGIHFQDHIRSLEMARIVLSLAIKFLDKKGSFVCKIFHGGSEKQFATDLALSFKEVKFIKPISSRKESSEVYIVAKGFNK